MNHRNLKKKLTKQKNDAIRILASHMKKRKNRKLEKKEKKLNPSQSRCQVVRRGKIIIKRIQSSIPKDD